VINWKGSGPSLHSGPERFSWEDMSEDLPVDVMPCSNEEYFPPRPSKEQIGIMRLADAEVERWRRKFNMSRRQFVRTAAATVIGFWAIDMIVSRRETRPRTGCAEVSNGIRSTSSQGSLPWDMY